MLARDRLRYFSHDFDMRNDLKIRGLRSVFGCEGYAVWCFMLEVLTDSATLCINYKQQQILLASDFGLSPDRLDQIIIFCEGVGLLQRDGDIIYSTRHQERLAAVNAKAQKATEKASKAANARWAQRQRETEAMHKQCISNAQAMLNDANKRREDKKGEEEKRIKSATELPCDSVVGLWNEICQSLPKVKRLSGNRRAKVKSRLREWGSSDSEQLAKARELFTRVEASDFLSGRAGKWSATFDWLFGNDGNWVKVDEGNYDNKKGNSTPRNSTNGLGAGEFIDEAGRRTYGSGKAIIPNDAPPRPSERHAWNAINQQWVL